MAKKKKSSNMVTSESLIQKKRKQESPLTQQHGDRDEKKSSNHNSNNRPRNQRIKSKRAAKEEAEERRLTALLFGGVDTTAGQLEDQDEMERVRKQAEEEEEQLTSDDKEEGTAGLVFEIDRTGADANQPEEKQSKSAPHEGGLRIEEEGNEERLNYADSDKGGDDDSEKGDEEDQDKGPAWVDEDDDNLEVDLLGTDRLRKLRKNRDESQPVGGNDLQKRLRARYRSTMQATAQTQWAKVHDDDEPDENDNQEQEEEDDMMLSSQPLLHQGKSSATARLPPNILKIMRCPDANQSDYNKAVVQAVHFHPGSDPDKPLLLTAGLDKTLRFFQVGAEKSEKVHGIHFPKLPIYSASFLGETGKVVVSGRRPFFYVYDSVAGKLDYIPRIRGREEKSLEKCFPSPDGKLIAFVGNDGYVILVDVHSKQWLANLKLNGSVRAVTFTPDGQYILASGSDGDVYRWDLRSRKCVERFANQDGTITSYLAASTRRHLAVGSESGVVNLYSDEMARRTAEKNAATPTLREPIRSIMNLQTSTDMLRFNHDGQILAMSSRREKNSLKLLHVPTATVFSNWPTSKTPLQYVWSMDFSPQSKFLAMGNDKGKCLLYTLQHYG